VAARREDPVRGYFQYHAIPGNWRELQAFRAEVVHHWCRSLRRPSQRNRPWWFELRDRLSVLLPPVQILQPYPDRRFDVKHHSIRGKDRVR
jgi:hypothetical protein